MTEREKIDAYFEKHAGEMLDDLKTLIKIPSIKSEALPGMPFGAQNAKVLETALKIASEKGLICHNVDNYVGTADINNNETTLGILAHLDVMPEGIGWHFPAFDMTVSEDKIYGRGTADDKGPAIASLYALLAAKEIRPDLKKNVKLILGTDEECGSSDIAYYFSKEAPPKYVFSPDANFPVLNVEKGRLSTRFGAKWSKKSNDLRTGDNHPEVLSITGGERFNAVPFEAKAILRGISKDKNNDGFKYSDLMTSIKETSKNTGISFSIRFPDDEKCEITATGVNAHGSTPEEGNNALTGLLRMLSTLPLAESESGRVIKELYKMFPHGDTLGKALGIDCFDELSGALSMNFSILNMDETGFEAGFDCRSAVSANQDFIIQRLRERLESFGAMIINEGVTPPHVVDKDSPFVQTLLKIYHDYTGKESYPTSTGGGTYVHDIKGGVGFGCVMPGVDNHMHGADEFAIISDLILSAKMFTQAIFDICGQ